MKEMNEFYGSPHGAFIGQVSWVTNKGGYLLGLLHVIRSVEIPRYPESRALILILGGTFRRPAECLSVG